MMHSELFLYHNVDTSSLLIKIHFGGYKCWSSGKLETLHETLSNMVKYAILSSHQIYIIDTR